VVSGPAASEFEGVLGGAPVGFASAFVTAVPVTDLRGRTMAVVSLYHGDRNPADDLAEREALITAASLAAHQLELLAAPAPEPELPVPEPELVFAGSVAGG
jgi:hypothetical protein